MGAFTNLASLGLNFALAQQAARRESGAINRERDRQIQDIQARTEEQRRSQQEALRRRLATQRARSGAAGVGGGGSAQAVLRGLTEEAEAMQEAGRAGEARERNLLELVGGASRSTLSLLGSGSRRRSLLDF